MSPRLRCRAVSLVLLASLTLAIGGGCSGEAPRRTEGERRSEPIDTTARPRFETPTVNSAIEYDGRLVDANDYGASGSVRVNVDDSRLTVQLAVRGLRAGGSYRVAVHGFADRRLSALPPFRSTLTRAEFDEAAGPQVLVVADRTVADAGGRISLTRELRVAEAVYPLDVRALLVSELREEGPLPAAACLLEPAELGDQGVGGPGGGIGGDAGGGTGVGGGTGGAGNGAGGDGGTGGGRGTGGGGGGSGSTTGGASP